VTPPTGRLISSPLWPVEIASESVASVAFQSEDNAVHTVYLTNGSHFAGLMMEQQFTMTLAGTSGAAATTAPVEAIGAGQRIISQPPRWCGFN